MNETIVHVAGQDWNYQGHLRQRCSWCGTTLIDVKLTDISAPVNGMPIVPNAWPIGHWVVENNGSLSLFPQVFGGIPSNACLELDPVMTR